MYPKLNICPHPNMLSRTGHWSRVSLFVDWYSNGICWSYSNWLKYPWF